MNHYATNMYRDKAGRHYWFAKLLEEKGYEPIVFCANTFHNSNEIVDVPSGKYQVLMEEKIPYIFVKTYRSEGNGIRRVINMATFFMHLFPVSKKVKKKYGTPDVILASSVHPLTLVAGIMIAKRLHVPCICEIRDLWPEAIFAFGKTKETSFIGRILIAGEHWIYKKADALIFTKEGDHEYLIERGWTKEQGGDIDLKKCHYINNGVNVNAYEQAVNQEILADEDLEKSGCFNVTYAGMIRPVNNVGNLLDTAKILLDYPEIQFLIYGAGSQMEDLKQRVIDEKLKNVKMKGHVDRKYIPYILSRSSVNILNYAQNQYNWSRGNSSNKLFEYMASGKPIISTVKMGYDPIEKYKCGLTIDSCTADSLAKAILELYQMPQEQYAEYAENAKKAARDFDFHVLVDKLKNVIESVK